ncbi:MAG: excinuclease ABC subunit A [Flammeovirgaceae bacterium]|nr:excinuclease ABC subunit A [Flammeovirgaceae bacterium]
MNNLNSDFQRLSEKKNKIEILGARENNLKNINLVFPKNKLIVFTGISGSGKSSLAFDTIYAEGQRRYMESFSAYARTFIGNMERPNVDKINGLSPVISIEQKTTSKNPRSTVGTLTEIYDFLRLLFARISDPISYVSGKKMTRQNFETIYSMIKKNYDKKSIFILSPVVIGRKGNYKELFIQIIKMGFTQVRVDGEIVNISKNMEVDRYSIHDIEIVIDKLKIDKSNYSRLEHSIKLALDNGNDSLYVINEDNSIHYYSKKLMDPESGISYEEPSPNNFSFNSPYGACKNCNGLGIVEEVDQGALIEDKNLSISRGGIIPLGMYRDIWIFKKIESILKRNKLDITTPIKNIPENVLNEIFYGSNNEIGVKSKKYPGTIWNTKYEGIINFMTNYKNKGPSKWKLFMEHFFVEKKCSNCQGKRLKKESLHFLINKKNIFELTEFSIIKLNKWFEKLPKKLKKDKHPIAAPILKEINKRIKFLLDVGLGYLNLNRPLKSLSGGEAQRIRLATQIGTQLMDVLYILDEPSIGLHQKDNDKLISSLKSLRDIGNTIIVVEHDKEMMLNSDYIVDIGPGPGVDGGEIVAQGHPKVFKSQDTLTAKYLNGSKIISNKNKLRTKTFFIELKGASGFNLKNINLKFPLSSMVCITGVSGSGKSTLINKTLAPILKQKLYNSRQKPLPYISISGVEHIDKIIEVDQSPIGRTPRSNPATYIGVFSDIRILFSKMLESKIRGFKPGSFSFNVKGGRCEVCRGAGIKIIEMDFLPNVKIECDSCYGQRYNRETLEVRFQGKSIFDVLNMTVDEACVFFKKNHKIFKKLKSLLDVGLGYISLGQYATTLSGGEAQRIKLAAQLSKKDTGKTLYLLDEPTTGLHFKDIENLLLVLNELIEKGNSVLIIEHNMDIIKSSDYIIDIGPDGGENGGNIVVQGDREIIIKNQKSYTGKFLKKELISNK